MSEKTLEKLDSGGLKRWDRRGLLAGLVAASVLVALGTFVFSESIETLDVKAEELGFEGLSLLPAPFPEYTVPGLEDPVVNFLLGVISVVIVLVVAFAVGKLLSSSQRSRGVPSA